jgi:hypothetical protein
VGFDGFAPNPSLAAVSLATAGCPAPQRKPRRTRALETGFARNDRPIYPDIAGWLRFRRAVGAVPYVLGECGFDNILALRASEGTACRSLPPPTTRFPCLWHTPVADGVARGAWVLCAVFDKTRPEGRVRYVERVAVSASWPARSPTLALVKQARLKRCRDLQYIGDPQRPLAGPTMARVASRRPRSPRSLLAAGEPAPTLRCE